jgi:putative nucleotidyltransferase with HDIG domain
MFSLSGYQVSTADSGALGLELLAKESFDVIICDMRMPAMQGSEFFERVRKTWPQPVRILLTGYADTSSAIAAINQGEIYRYISKPWVDEELTATVRSAIEFSQLKKDREELLAITQKHNEELEQKVQERTEHLTQANAKLKASYTSSIKSFSTLLELRQPNLLFHSKKVAYLSMEMAKLAGFDEKQVQEVFIAGLLHDIGKIGLNDRVLGTSIAELPVSDLELYKSHPSLGANALAALDDMQEIATMIRHHHERFDGKGFPQGLVGEQIPMGARIIAIVESYEELLNGDIAKSPQTKEQAQKIIHSLSNRYFCPKATALFFEALKKNK